MSEPTTDEDKVNQELHGVTNGTSVDSIPSHSTPPDASKTSQSQTTENTERLRQRLTDFYAQYKPEKLNDTASINEVIRRYHGRESKLFSDLHRKYNIPITYDNDHDIISHASDEEDDDDDESSPLNSKREKNSKATPMPTPSAKDKNPIASNIAIAKLASLSISDQDDDDDIALLPNPTNNAEKEKEKDLGIKIEVTKPLKKQNMKKKPIGTSLFGDTSKSKSHKKHKNNHSHKQFGSPVAFNNFSSQSISLGTPKIDEDLPRFGSKMIQKSNTLTKNDKMNLDKRRQSSLATRRHQNRKNLPIRINKVWSCFAQYLVDQMLEQQKIEKEEQQKEEKTEENELDSIINKKEESPMKEKRKKGAESLDVLDIDPRLFQDAKDRRESSRSSRASESSSFAEPEVEDDNFIVDVYTLSLSYSQFNIVLNNNDIEISPDMSAALIWLLLGCNDMISDEVRNLGLDSDNFHNDPMKERSFHSKQFKLIYKCTITYAMIECLMKKLGSGNIISRQDKSLHPKHLSYETRNYVIWDKIFDHLINTTSFNVESEYLYGALSEEELTNSQTIVSMLATLDSHWQHRVQLMEHIDDKLSNGSPMERDMFFASILADNNNYIRIITGWCVQLTDDRSGVARTAVTLLPGILASILLCIQCQSDLFNETEVIEPIYSGIFALVKNRRLKDMADDAYEALVQCTDIFAEVASSLNENYELMAMIVSVLENNSNPKIQKHDKCRESCIGGIAFLLYGIEQQLPQPNGAMDMGMSLHVHPTANSADKSMDISMDLKSIKTASKLSKEIQRQYLMKNDDFLTSFGKILQCGVTDKSEAGRKKAFKLLQRLEGEQEGKMLEELMNSKWDAIIAKKFTNFKKMEQRKKNSISKKRKVSRKRKKSAKSGSKIKNGKNKQSSKKNIKFQMSTDSILEEPENIKEDEENLVANANTTTTTIMITSDDNLANAQTT